MWNRSKSLTLSIFSTRLFALLLVAGVLLAPEVIKWYFGFSGGTENQIWPFRIIIYGCSLPAAALLYCLHLLLLRIRAGDVFTARNVALLRLISWCCFTIALITFASGFYYASFFIVAVAAAFIALIIRVIKNVFEQAIEIKSENDFTI